MRRGFWLSIILTVIFCTPALAYDWSTNPGNGSTENPYQISEPNHLMSIGSNPALLDKHFILTNDIVFDPNNNPAHVFTTALIAPDTDPNTNEFQGTYFTGSFDGDGYKVVDLVIDSNGVNDYLGLFGLVSQSPIRNLGIEGAYLDGDSKIGLLAGYTSGPVGNCYSSGIVHGGSYVGGLIGSCRGTTVNCFSTCSVSGTSYLGGLIGDSVTGSIANCYATGSVTGSDERIGGLVGYNYRCDIGSSYAIGEVEGDWAVGGLLGQSYDCLVTRSYAAGNVTGRLDVGGLVGEFYSTGEISNCYATGSVIADINVGGLVGRSEMSVSYSYAIGNIQGNQNIGCLIGFNFYQDGFGDGIVSDCFWLINDPMPGIGNNTGTVINTVGKSSGQMQMQSTFTNSPASWDFVGEDTNGENEIWRMCVDGVDYPRLSWEFAQNGDFACGDEIDILDLQALAEHWLLVGTTHPTEFNYACDANGDEVIDFLDFAVLGENW